MTCGHPHRGADDAPAIGALHVASWRETYADLLPRHVVRKRSVADRTAMWTDLLSGPDETQSTRVFVAEAAGRIVGFGACGGQRDGAMRACGFDGEIAAIYVLRSAQRASVGRSLMRLMFQELNTRGHGSASLGTLRDNGVARRFYEGLGGVATGEKTVVEDGDALHQIAYGWRRLPDLAP